MSRRPLAIAITCAAGLFAGGCGAGAARPDGRRAAAGPVRYLAPDALRVQLGNGVRAGLYELSVMGQRDDDAPDLGQPLPTGLVDRVHCVPAVPRPARGSWAWDCRVAWQTVAGAPQTTRYAVALTPRACFTASARPSRPARYDATIHSFSADPLDQLASVRRGC